AADVMILVVNVQEGVVPLDEEVSARLRKSGKPVLVAANKADTFKMEDAADEFVRLGFSKIFPVSAIHGGGIEELMKAALALLPAPTAEEIASPAAAPEERGRRSRRAVPPNAPADAVDADSVADEATTPPEAPAFSGPLKLAIVGRPNVGKSSIINALTHS